MHLMESDKQRLVNAIALAETGSRGELRVHIEAECKGDALDRARFFFHQFEMHATKDGTGVLLYVSPGSRKTAIFAGPGIHKPAGGALWANAVKTVADGFRAGDGIGGIESAILLVGEALRRCAPGEDEAGNELANEVTSS